MMKDRYVVMAMHRNGEGANRRGIMIRQGMHTLV